MGRFLLTLLAILLATSSLRAQLPTNSFAVTSACQTNTPSTLSKVNTDGSLTPIGTVTDAATNTGIILNALGYDAGASPQTVLYGMNVVQPINITNFSTPPNLYRVSLANAQATNLGTVTPPPTPTSGLSGVQPGETGFVDYRQTFNFIGDGGPGSTYFVGGATFRVFFRSFIVPSRVADLRLYVGVVALAPFTTASPAWNRLDTSDPATTTVVADFQNEVQTFLTNGGTGSTPGGGLQDWVFDVRSGNLVSYLGKNGKFLTVSNPGSNPVGVTTDIAPLLTPIPTTDNIGAMFTDRDGNVYAVTADAGTIYKIDRLTGNYSGQSFGSAFGCSRGDAVSLPGALPLPVTLTQFSAVADGGAVRLAWATASEENADAFLVQRSKQGTIWQILQTVPASNQPRGQRYTATDAAPLVGQSYYRLAMRDTDGSIAYSPVQAMKIRGKALAAAYPNPSPDGQLIVQLEQASEAGTILELLNATGQRVRRAEAAVGATALPFDARGLPGGMYYLRVLQPGATSTVPVVLAPDGPR